jgi:hypothetical protein
LVLSLSRRKSKSSNAITDEVRALAADLLKTVNAIIED